MNLVGRQREQTIIRDCLESGKPEFVAIYGRRRVGKTFLARKTLGRHLVFSCTGVANSGMRIQLAAFDEALKESGLTYETPSSQWQDAFSKLKELLKGKKGKRKVVFIDELPWMATPKSGMLQALEHFWNSWGSAQDDLMLVVCGSAASWLIDNIINNHGGLYGRVTKQIKLEPFNLYECEEYFKARQIFISRFQIAKIYLVLGGIPYYLDHVTKGLSPEQNIDRLFFAKGAPLRNEYKALIASLFSRPQSYAAVVEALAGTERGMTRDEIADKSGLRIGGRLTEILEALEQNGFITVNADFHTKKNGKRYLLADFFVRFHFAFLNTDDGSNPHLWQNLQGKGTQNNWYGKTFELLCRTHVMQIKQRLGIPAVQTRITAWRSMSSEPVAQIDLIIDRKDDIIDLCEMKFSAKKYAIDAAYDERLREKRETFAEETKTTKSLHTVMVTANGLTPASYRGEVQSEVVLDDLFAQEWE